MGYNPWGHKNWTLLSNFTTTAFPGDLTHPGLQPSLSHLPHWQADSLPLHHLGSHSVGVVVLV